MARVSDLRDDARRTLFLRRTRVSATPVRASRAVVLGALAVLLTIASGVAIGLPAGWVLAGALGVICGAVLAGRRTVTNLAAGAALRVARPYCPGEQVRLYLPEQRRVTDAEIIRIGPANTALLTSTGVVVVPNTHLLRPAAA